MDMSTQRYFWNRNWQGGVGIYLVVFIIPSMGKDGNSTPIENILGLNLNLNCYP